MNSFTGLGRLTKDVDLRYTQTGTAVAEFTLAINRKFKNKQTGEYDADFIRCKAFNKRAELVANHLKKGNQVGIEATIQTGSYENKDGHTVYTTEAIIDAVTFINAPKGSNSNATSNYEQSNTNTPPTQEQAVNTLYGTGNDSQQVYITDDDLPF